MLTQLISRIKVKTPIGKPSGSTSPYLQFNGLGFIPPAGWTSDDASGGLLVVNPKIERDWQAHLYFELREASGAEFKTLEEALGDLVEELTQKKEKFHLISKRVEKHDQGFSLARMEYTCVYEGTLLRESEILMDLEGAKRLYLMTSVADVMAEVYQAIFEKVVRSFLFPYVEAPAPVAPTAVEPPRIAPVTAEAPSATRAELEGVNFDVPSGWSLKEVGAKKKLLSASVTEGGITPSLHLEFVPSSSGTPVTPEVMIAERVAGLKKDLQTFQEIKRWSGPDAEGVEISLIEYSFIREKTPCTEFLMVFQFPSGNFWVRASAPSTLWAKYQPLFAVFVASVASGEIAGIEIRDFEGLSFVVPDGWSDAPHEEGYVLMDPSEEKGDGTIFLEKKADPGVQTRTLEEIFEDYLPTLEAGYPGFAQLQCRVGDHPAGFPFGFVEFTYQRDGIPYTQREFIVELDPKHRIYLLLSAKTSGWTEYLPLFDQFVYSLQKA